MTENNQDTGWDELDELLLDLVNAVHSNTSAYDWGIRTSNNEIKESKEAIKALFKQDQKKQLDELKDQMSRLYVRKEPVEGELGQFLGVYIARWRSEWGEPTSMFAEYESPDTELEEEKEDE